MNWYKTSQEYPPIAIISYIPSYEELGISFNGGKKYTYYGINPFIYEKIRKSLQYKNYSNAKKILFDYSKSHPRQETEEDREEILNELYERGFFDKGSNWEN